MKRQYPHIETKKLQPTLTQYEVSELPELGWITMTEMGEENLYFTFQDGSKGFCKLHAWSPQD